MSISSNTTTKDDVTRCKVRLRKEKRTNDEQVNSTHFYTYTEIWNSRRYCNFTSGSLFDVSSDIYFLISFCSNHPLISDISFPALHAIPPALIWVACVSLPVQSKWCVKCFSVTRKNPHRAGNWRIVLVQNRQRPSHKCQWVSLAGLCYPPSACVFNSDAVTPAGTDSQNEGNIPTEQSALSLLLLLFGNKPQIGNPWIWEIWEYEYGLFFSV